MKSLCSVAKKLELLLEGELPRATREIGFPLARKLGAIAQEWGNKSARKWSLDLRFAKFLAAMNFNANWHASMCLEDCLVRQEVSR
jgi:hypothetical protein